MIANGDKGSAGASVQYVGGNADCQKKYNESDEVEPAIPVDAQSRGRHWLDEIDALLAAGPGIEVFEQLRRGERHSQSDEREVRTFESQRRQAE
jgi:hypothetical protein